MEQSSADLLRVGTLLGSVRPKSKALEVFIGERIHLKGLVESPKSVYERQEMEITEASFQLHKLSVVCERTSLSRSTVWREIKAGRLNAIRVGKCLRVSETELQRFIRGLELANAR
jgi:excisionase family DNA binding protein